MCHLCAQREVVETICEETGIAFHGQTDMSMILITGSEQDEDMSAIVARSSLAISALHVAGFTCHAHRGNFKPMHYITVLHQTQPGSNPSLFRH